MKKILVLVLALLLVLSLASCDKDKETTDADTSTLTPPETTTLPSGFDTEPADESTSESEETTTPESTTVTPSSAFVEVKETVYVYGTEILDIRESYSSDSDKVGEMKEGESVTRTGHNEEWSRISFYGKTCYARSEFLTTKAPLLYTDNAEKVYVNSPALELRAKASSEATVVVTLKYGDEIERTGVSTTKDEQGNEWSRVLYNGQVCFANSQYLSVTPPASEHLTFEEKNDVVYTVVQNTVNLREGSSTTATICAVLEAGVRLERTGLATAPDAEGITWNRVLHNGQVCYISSACLTTFTDADETLYVTADVLNMRELPSTSGKVLKLLEKGTELQCIGKATTSSEEIVWYKVSYDGETGYCSSKYLSETKP